MRLRHIPGAEEAIARSPYVIQEPKEKKGKWREVFGNDHPIHIEVGMGKGRFIMELAERNPEVNYIGIERYSTVLLKALQKREKLPLSNICFMCVDAKELGEMFEPGEVKKIYLNFSDPWPKKRAHKKRLSNHAFIARYAHILKPDGEIQMKTDNSALFEYSLMEFQEEGWRLKEVSVDYRREEHAEDVITEYERRFLEKGQPIYRAVFVKNGKEKDAPFPEK